MHGWCVNLSFNLPTWSERRCPSVVSNFIDKTFGTSTNCSLICFIMSHVTRTSLLVAVLCSLLCVVITSAEQLQFDKFTPTQRQAVSSFKELVKNERNLEKYMTEDYNLAKFLAISNFDVAAAHRLFEETVAWRAGYKIGSIFSENWVDMRRQFPYSRDTVDKEGKPIVYINFEDWDVAKFLSDGDSTANVERFIRYFALIAEETNVQIQELRESGKDVTQHLFIVNLSGFATLKHACIQCLYAYRDTSTTLGPRYPYAAEKNVFINTPLMFKVVYAFLPENSQKIIDLYGQDRAQWEPMLLNMMTPDQLPKGLLEDSNPKEKDNIAGFLQWRKEL